MLYGCQPLSPPRLPSDSHQGHADFVTSAMLLAYVMQMAASGAAISFHLATRVSACAVTAHAHPT